MSYIYGAPILDVSRSHTTTHTISAGERPVATHLLRSWVRIPPGAWIFVCCECRVLSGRGLCNELITRPEESYRLCCVVVCDLETSRMGAPYIYDISRLRVNVQWKWRLSHIRCLYSAQWGRQAQKHYDFFYTGIIGFVRSVVLRIGDIWESCICYCLEVKGWAVTYCVSDRWKAAENVCQFNPLKTQRRLLYLKTQSVPRCKHFSSLEVVHPRCVWSIN